MDVRSWFYLGLTLASPAVLCAQHTKPATRGRVAGIAPPAPAPPQPIGGSSLAPGNVYYGNVPVLVLTDGRVYADFGRGYEQVVRTCGLPISYGGAYGGGIVVSNGGPVQPVVVQPSVSQPAVGAAPPLPYTPPVPAQQTASEQMAAQVGRPPQTNSSTVLGQPCWGVRADGLIIVRP